MCRLGSGQDWRTDTMDGRRDPTSWMSAGEDKKHPELRGRFKVGRVEGLGVAAVNSRRNEPAN